MSLALMEQEENGDHFLTSFSAGVAGLWYSGKGLLHASILVTSIHRLHAEGSHRRRGGLECCLPTEVSLAGRSVPTSSVSQWLSCRHALFLFPQNF